MTHLNIIADSLEYEIATAVRSAATRIDEQDVLLARSESALERLYRNTKHLMAGLPVRDLGETYAEVEAVLAAIREEQIR